MKLRMCHLSHTIWPVAIYFLTMNSSHILLQFFLLRRIGPGGVDSAYRGYLQSLIHSSCREINIGTVDELRCRCIWKQRQGFAHWWRVSPYLEHCSTSTHANILSSFTDGVRQGHFGRGHRVTAQSVDQAVREVGQTIQLASRSDPTKVYGRRKHIIQLPQLLESYHHDDPPLKPQLVVLVTVIEHLQAAAH